MVYVHARVRFKDEATFPAALIDSFEWTLLGDALQKTAHGVLRQCISNIHAKDFGLSTVYLFAHFFRHAAHALESWTKGILCCRRALTAADLTHDLSKLFVECCLSSPSGVTKSSNLIFNKTSTL